LSHVIIISEQRCFECAVSYDIITVMHHALHCFYFKMYSVFLHKHILTSPVKQNCTWN